MPEHWDWCGDCKTPRCGRREQLRYIGTAMECPDDTGHIDRKFPLTLQCRSCRSIHHYTLADLRPFKSEDPPAGAFGNTI